MVIALLPVLFLIGLSGCGSSTSTASSSGKSAVIEGWKSAFRAFDSAVRDADWRSKALVRTQTAPQYRRVERNLQNESIDHERAIGEDRVINVEVTKIAGSIASVGACVQGDEVIVNSSGKPVSGVLGQSGPERIVAQMARDADGWKLASQTVTEGKCSAD
ncbi:MAG: hypothetical protein ACRD6W_12660 [Nitrososphaerales archaeon]